MLLTFNTDIHLILALPYLLHPPCDYVTDITVITMITTPRDYVTVIAEVAHGS